MVCAEKDIKKRPSSIARDGRIQINPRYHPDLRQRRTLNKVKKPLPCNGSTRPAPTTDRFSAECSQATFTALPDGAAHTRRKPAAPSLNRFRLLLLLLTASDIRYMCLLYHFSSFLSSSERWAFWNFPLFSAKSFCRPLPVRRSPGWWHR